MPGREVPVVRTYVSDNRDTEVWREDEGIAYRVPKFYPEPERKLLNARQGLTMEEVAKHDKRDDLWIIVDGKAYDVTKFADRHPGGWLPMMNLGGKDCTDAFANYHPARVYRSMLPHFYVGDVVDYKESEFVKEHREMRQMLLEQGLFETRQSYYWGLGAWLAFLAFSVLYTSLVCSSTAAHLTGAALLGTFWQQMAFLGHDIGHNAVSHVRVRDSVGGLLVGNFLTGIAMSWWKLSHNVHHVCCNSIEHDPDIQHMPIFAVSDEIFHEDFYSTFHKRWVRKDAAALFLVSYQHWLFYPIMAFARFNLYAQSWILLLDQKEYVWMRNWEILGQLGFLSWLGALVANIPVAADSSLGAVGERVAFVLLSHVLAGVLHVQICLSHFARDTYHGKAYNGEEDEWFRMQCLTTLNIDCPWWMDWFHGGLQFQIEHHLWPRLPRHNLRHAQTLVKAFCKKHGVVYHNLPWIPAQIELIRCLKDAALKMRASQAVENTEKKQV